MGRGSELALIAAQDGTGRSAKAAEITDQEPPATGRKSALAKAAEGAGKVGIISSFSAAAGAQARNGTLHRREKHCSPLAS